MKFFQVKNLKESLNCVKILSQDMLVGIGFGGEGSLNLDQFFSDSQEEFTGWWSWWLVMNVSNFLWWWLFQIPIIDYIYKPIRYHHFFVKLLAFQTSFGLCGRLPKEAKRHEIGLLQPITMLFCSQSLRCIGAVTAIRSHKGGPKKYCKNGGSWAVVNLRNFFSGPLRQLLTS